MPSRPWRKCETCEWFIEPWCTNVKITVSLNNSEDLERMGIIEENGCSEWKSAEPETCGMCHWFRLFDGSSFKGICNHVTAGAHNYESRLGACDHFRRVE